MPKERVQKIMSNAGFCSRRRAEDYIAEGKVKVNDVIITLGDKADPKEDTITCNGTKIFFERKRYIKFYKSLYTLTSMYDPSEKPTIYEYLDSIKERVYPIGRLDYNAEGLLILTNDGNFANKIMHPRYETHKTYQALLTEPFKNSDLAKLKGELYLKDGPVTIESAKIISSQCVEIQIHEGRNKIVKRILNEIGYRVKTLKRTKINNIDLGNLKPNQFIDLTKAELKKLLD